MHLSIIFNNKLLASTIPHIVRTTGKHTVCKSPFQNLSYGHFHVWKISIDYCWGDHSWILGWACARSLFARDGSIGLIQENCFFFYRNSTLRVRGINIQQKHTAFDLGDKRGDFQRHFITRKTITLIVGRWSLICMFFFKIFISMDRFNLQLELFWKHPEHEEYGVLVRRTRVDSETFWSAERVRLHHQHTPYSRYQVMEFWFWSKQKKNSTNLLILFFLLFLIIVIFQSDDLVFFCFGKINLFPNVVQLINSINNNAQGKMDTETNSADGNKEISLGVHFALCIIKSSTTRSYWALFLGRWSPFLFILC